MKISTETLLKDLTLKHRKAYYCIFDGIWYTFKSSNNIIIPFPYLQKYGNLKFKNKISIQLIDSIPKLQLQQISSNQQEKRAVAVLLGHFNHGKTSILDNLAGSTLVENEKHGITQVLS